MLFQVTQIIDRETMPHDVSQQLVKSEFLVDKINKVMNIKSALGRLLSISDSRPKSVMLN